MQDRQYPSLMVTHNLVQTLQVREVWMPTFVILLLTLITRGLN